MGPLQRDDVDATIHHCEQRASQQQQQEEAPGCSSGRSGVPSGPARPLACSAPASRFRRHLAAGRPSRTTRLFGGDQGGIRQRPRAGTHAQQTLLLRHPVQGSVRQEHLRALGPHLRGLLQPIPGATASFTMQEELFHNGILQGLPGCLAANGRNGKYSNLDKAIAWGRSRGLGPNASALLTLMGALWPFISKMKKTSITRWSTSWGSKGSESATLKERWAGRRVKYWRRKSRRRGRRMRDQGYGGVAGAEKTVKDHMSTGKDAGEHEKGLTVEEDMERVSLWTSGKSAHFLDRQPGDAELPLDLRNKNDQGRRISSSTLPTSHPRVTGNATTE